MAKAQGRSRELVAAFAATGAGKTTIGRHKVETTGPASALLLDRLARFPTSFSSGFAEKIFGDVNDLVREVRARVETGASFRFSFAPPPNAEPQAAGYLCRLAKWASESGGVESWVVLEEAASSCAKGVVDPATVECARDGRHFGVSMCGLSQRPVGISPDVRAELMAGELWVGRLTDWNDASYLARRLGRERAATLGALETVKDNDWSRWYRLAEGSAEPENWVLRFRGGRPDLYLAAAEVVS